MTVLTNIITGKDNKTHDIVRVLLLAIVSSLVVILWSGVSIYIYGYYKSLDNPAIKLFDIQTFFTSTSTYALGVAAFIVGGGLAIFLKKDTEPSETVSKTE